MIELTPKASRLIADYFRDHPRKPIRIHPKTGQCGIQVLGISMEQPQPSDRVIAIDGFDFIVDKDFIAQAQPIKMDSDGIGFILTGKGFYSTSGCGNCGFMGCH